MPKTTVDIDQIPAEVVTEEELAEDNPVKYPVKSDVLTTSPESPVIGDRYIIAGTGGAWSAFLVWDIVEYTATGWVREIPKTGDQVYVEAVEKYKAFDGTEWVLPGSGANYLSELLDVGSASPSRNNVLVGTGTVFDASPHRLIAGLEHDINQACYVEYQRTLGLITAVIVWESAAKLRKIREYILSRSSGLVSSITSKQYNGSGVLEETLTAEITRQSGLFSYAEVGRT